MNYTCTLKGHTAFNNGWAWKYFTTVTGYGHWGYGKSVNGLLRTICLKFTTPETVSSMATYLQIKIPLTRSSYSGGGTDKFQYFVIEENSSYPDFVNDGGGKAFTFPPENLRLVSGSQEIYVADQNSGYATKTIKFSKAYKYKSNTTYQVWIYSETPYSAYYTTGGFYGNGGGVSRIIITLEEPEVPPEPTIYFAWDTAKTNTSWSISAAEWNRFCEVFTKYTGITVHKKYAAGDYLTVEQFNEIARILGLKYRIFNKNQFKGEYLNDFAKAINTLADEQAE